MVKSKIEDKNLAVVLHKPDDLRIENTPMPGPPAPDDVTLKCEFCGICGTDVHLWKHAKLGTFSVEKPLILGHEAVATVIAVGASVKGFKAGDKVVIENAIPCMKCKYCLRGTYNYCEVCSRQAKGLPPADGLLRQYYNHPAAFVHKIPSSLKLEIAALAEPLAVSVHALNRVGLKYGQKVLITGAGTMGLLTMVCAKAYGASKVCMVDIVKQKLQASLELGADCFVLSVKGATPDTVAEDVIKQLGEAPEVTIEATGSEFCLNVAIAATSVGGKIGLIGLGPEKLAIPVSKASLKEIDLMGVCRYRNSYPQAVELLSSRKEFEPFITSVFTLDKALDAFAAMSKGQDIKILIKCN